LDKLSEWLLFEANSAIFQLYHGEVNFQWIDDEGPLCTRPTRLLDLYSASSRQQLSTDRHVPPHPPSHTLARFPANLSILFLLNAVCLAEKQQIPDQGSNPRSTPRDEHTNHYTTDVIPIKFTKGNNNEYLCNFFNSHKCNQINMYLQQKRRTY
jgi:hypothetical protein